MICNKTRINYNVKKLMITVCHPRDEIENGKGKLADWKMYNRIPVDGGASICRDRNN